jgi:hypothetical protein
LSLKKKNNNNNDKRDIMMINDDDPSIPKLLTFYLDKIIIDMDISYIENFLIYKIFEKHLLLVCRIFSKNGRQSTRLLTPTKKKSALRSISKLKIGHIHVRFTYKGQAS